MLPKGPPEWQGIEALNFNSVFVSHIAWENTSYLEISICNKEYFYIQRQAVLLFAFKNFYWVKYLDFDCNVNLKYLLSKTLKREEKERDGGKEISLYFNNYKL